MEKVCWYQAFGSPNQHREGWGDCSKCTAHTDNVNCKGYHRVILRTFTATGGKDETIQPKE